MTDIQTSKRFVLLSLVLSSITLQSKARQSKPNIILFLVDDMGWQDTSVPLTDSIIEKNKTFHTPNMQRLAAEGIRFTNAYAAPVSTPTRVSLMTGMNVSHHHVTNWTHPLKNTNTDSKNDDQFGPADWNLNGMSPIPGVEHTVYATPLPMLLNESGYYTVHVGKAHWGSIGTPAANPLNIGFEVNIAGHAAGHPQSYLSQDAYGNKPGQNSYQAVPDLEEYHYTGTFLTDALTQEALKAIQRPIKNKQPFFLQLAHYAVHTPIMADSLYYQKYIDLGLDPIEARYASLIEGMDASLGAVMDFLEKEGVDDNTVIFFLSDNGGLSQIPHRAGVANTQNLPLKAGKGSVYEGGIRTPLIVKYPKLIKPNTISKQYMIVEDLFPTILDLAGIKKRETVQSIDGQTLLPIFRTKDYCDNERVLIWHYPNKWIANDGPGINYFSAIRKGDWKLVWSIRTQKSELYNLKDDMGENHDLSYTNPSKTNELLHLLGESLKANQAPMPFDKANNRFVPYPGIN